jgi:hypothetical protein
VTVTIGSFRQDFPEFGNSGVYQDSVVTFWLNLGVQLFDPTIWATLVDAATELFIAHNLVLEQQSLNSNNNGGVPGINSGPLNSKGVDKVHAGYDTGASTLAGFGNFNLTTYGTRLAWLVNMVGIGGIQTGSWDGSDNIMSAVGFPM